jgi:hypothetical protein
VTARSGWNHQSRARRRAGRLDQELRQPQTFGGEPIDARRRSPAQLSAAVDPNVAVTCVVGENEQDVGFLLLRECRINDYRQCHGKASKLECASSHHGFLRTAQIDTIKEKS